MKYSFVGILALVLLFVFSACSIQLGPMSEKSDEITDAIKESNDENSMSSDEVKTDELAIRANKGSITFMDIPWYSTKEKTERFLSENGIDVNTYDSYNHCLYRMAATDYCNMAWGDDYVEDGGSQESYYCSVAGYDNVETTACYIYPIKNGEIVRSDDNALFYFGWYSFDTSEYSDHKAIYDDLLNKLISLYGEGVTESGDYNTTVTWKDSAENQIRILIDKDETYVTLGYMAAGADEKLDEIQRILDEEAAAEEEKNRENNKSNASGL